MNMDQIELSIHILERYNTIPEKIISLTKMPLWHWALLYTGTFFISIIITNIIYTIRKDHYKKIYSDDNFITNTLRHITHTFLISSIFILIIMFAFTASSNDIYGYYSSTSYKVKEKHITYTDTIDKEIDEITYILQNTENKNDIYEIYFSTIDRNEETLNNQIDPKYAPKLKKGHIYKFVTDNKILKGRDPNKLYTPSEGITGDINWKNISAKEIK